MSLKLNFTLIALSLGVLSGTPASASKEQPLTVVVMDPLSSKLACDCVKGYAQRKYEELGKHLEATLKRKVEVIWSESLVTALEETDGKADLVIGKHSVVRTDAVTAKQQMVPIAALTGKDGKTTQTGLIVVRKDDPAQSVGDLKGYRILFGPKDCDEKSAAPMALLKGNGVSVPDQPETADTCSIAVTKLMELPADEKAAAVISSYAEPLLAGCGTIQKGDLRVIGSSDEVPFITAFVNGALSSPEREALAKALRAVGTKPELLTALETLEGFVDFPSKPAVAADLKKKN